MAKNHSIKIFIDPYGNTLNVWWGNPKDSAYSEEADESWDVIVMNKRGKPIGFEKLGLFPKELDPFKYLGPRANHLLEAHEKEKLVKSDTRQSRRKF